MGEKQKKIKKKKSDYRRGGLKTSHSTNEPRRRLDLAKPRQRDLMRWPTNGARRTVLQRRRGASRHHTTTPLRIDTIGRPPTLIRTTIIRIHILVVIIVVRIEERRELDRRTRGPTRGARDRAPRRGRVAPPTRSTTTAASTRRRRVDRRHTERGADRAREVVMMMVRMVLLMLAMAVVWMVMTERRVRARSRE
jgi:hypothetical protein